MSGALISEEMQNAVGRVFETQVSYPITDSDIRRWVVATYHPHIPPAEFWDPDAIAALPGGRLVAPHEFNPFTWMLKEPAGLGYRFGGPVVDRIETALGIAGPKLRHGLNAGLEASYFERMAPGDVIRAETSVESYDEKKGRMGQMLITRTLSRWTNQRDQLVKTFRQTFIRY